MWKEKNRNEPWKVAIKFVYSPQGGVAGLPAHQSLGSHMNRVPAWDDHEVIGPAGKGGYITWGGNRRDDQGGGHEIKDGT